MNRWRTAVLAVLILAVMLSAVDAVGERWWRATARLLASRPQAGAARLAAMPSWVPPEAIRRSRRLVERDLAAATPELVVRALERLAALQLRWFFADPIGFRNAGSAAMIDGRLDDAAARLSRLVERRFITTAVRARAWSQLASVRALADDADGAEAATRTALELAPGSTAPYVAMAEIAERRGDWTGALDALRRAWGLAPADPRMLARVARAAERAGELGDARLALERAVELEPGVPEHALRLVDFLIRNGQYMDATMELTRALNRFPTDPRLARQLERLQREIETDR